MRRSVSISIILCFVILLVSMLFACGDTYYIPSTISQSAGGVITDKILTFDDEPPAEIRYTVTFSTGTNEVIPDMQLLILSKSQAPQPDNSYKREYRFEGWYTTSDFSGSAIDYPYTFFRNTTLYAKWVHNTTISIDTVEQLMDINRDLSGSYLLKRDLDLQEYGIWAPLGNVYEKADNRDELILKYEAFTGIFDGNGYTISNMIIQDLEEDENFQECPVGLFGTVNGLIKNVTLVDFKITLEGEKSRFMMGGIVGHLKEEGSLVNSQAKGEVINSEMTYRKKFVDTFWVTAKPSTLVSMGIAVGKVEGGEVRGCSTEGSVISYSNATKAYTDEDGNKYVGTVYCGGVVGLISSGKMEYSNSTATVYGKCAGGVVGYNNGTVYRCHASGTIEGSLSYPSVAGGLAACNNTLGVIYESYALGDVKGRTAGGLIGINKFDYQIATGGLVNNCYAKGDVYASEYAGGLIGRAVSDIPYFSWQDYSPLIFNPAQDNDRSGIDYKAIHHCFAYGNVIANASETTFEDEDGEEVRIIGVFYPVFAGGMVGQGNEVLIGNCIAFGDVEGVSHRIREDDGEINAKNPAYTNNFIGHNTAISATMQSVYCIQDQIVTRNGVEYSDSNTVDVANYSEINEGLFLRLLGFETHIWRLTGLDIANGEYPTLLG